VNLKIVLHRIAQGCGVCLPLLLIIGLLIPGCAGKRSDMLSSMIKPKQDRSEPGAADGESSGDRNSSSLIAGADSGVDNSQLSAFTAEEIIEGRPRLGTRVRSWFTRDSDALTAGDPFLNDETTADQEQAVEDVKDREAIASSESSGGGQSLASYETKQTAAKEPISEVKPWWQTGEPTEDRKGIASSGSRRVDELLSSFPTKQARQQQPEREAQSWWEAGTADAARASATMPPNEDALADAESPKTTFSGQFDSRLERLRAELNLDDRSVAAAEDAAAEDAAAGLPTAGLAAETQERPQQQDETATAASPTIASGSTVEQFNPFATAGEQSQELPIVAANGKTAAGQAYPSLLTQPRQSPGESRPTDTGVASAEDSHFQDAGSRVRMLMDEAQQDWQAWRLERAYRTAVAARDLALRENVEFLEGEERPRDLAEKIAFDFKQDVVTCQSPQALASKPFQQTDEVPVRSFSPPFGFEQLERLADPWMAGVVQGTTSSDLADRDVARSTSRKGVDASEPTVESRSSGVSLLPPDDDFPSDAEGRDWTHADPRDIRLANHRFSEFSRPGDQEIREQMRGLSAEDNQALLRNVADQRHRVLTSKGVQWPELPAAHQPAALKQRSSGPIQVAQAPRYTLADDMAVAASPESGPDGATAAAGGSLLGQFWHSQPIWFIGGLILLIAALRILPWPRKEDV
jgi:hypothetical protein